MMAQMGMAPALPGLMMPGLGGGPTGSIEVDERQLKLLYLFFSPQQGEHNKSKYIYMYI